MRRFAVIGAGGRMVRVACRELAGPGTELVLCDVDLDGLKEVAAAAEARGATTTMRQIDLFDAAALRSAIRGASLVVHGAGPYFRTTAPVVAACIEEKVDAIDMNDDHESVAAALGHDAALRDAGVVFAAGCGASPGLTNVLAASAARDLDTVDAIDVAWITGDDGETPMGRAVLEHLLHITAGDAFRWSSGRLEKTPSFENVEVFEMPAPVGECRLYEVGHPEPIMLSRSHPLAGRVRCFGGLHPVALNAIVQGVARAVRTGELTEDDAVAFFERVMKGSGTWAGWRASLPTLFEEIAAGHLGLGDVFAVVKAPPAKSAVLARATGRRNGSEVTVVRSSGDLPHDLLASMAEATGRSLAAFAECLLEKRPAPGLRFPDEIATLEEIRAALTAGPSAAGGAS